MKIALTGAKGFTGQHFASLARMFEHEVVAIESDLQDPTALTTEFQKHTEKGVFDAVVAEKIIVRGAREHNLKNISIDLPRDILLQGLEGCLV